jgi:outer membrane protein
MTAGRVSIAILSAGILLVGPASAIDLVETWRAAQDHDLEFSAARAAHEAGQARRDQGTALWRPTVSLTGTAGRMSNNTSTSGAQFSAPGFGLSRDVTFDTSVGNGTSENWAVTARQPLISGERLARRRQLEAAADLADLQWQAARQFLMLRSAERYFDLALAEELVRVLREQQTAVDRALEEARERFRLGDIPITDTHEATARSEAIKAQVLAADSDLQLKRIALADTTGLPPESLHPRMPNPDFTAAPVSALDRWIAQAAARNPTLLAQAATVDVAHREAEKFRVSASPSVDIVAKLGRDRLFGSGDFGTASNTTSGGMIGVQLTVPVFTGGFRSAQRQEALHLADQAHDEEALARQRIALQTRAAWLGCAIGAGRVAALSAALEASRSRLDATRLGRDVGERTTLDLLNAQSDASSAEVNLLQARIVVLMDRLRLASLAGLLDEEHLLEVNAGLQVEPNDTIH